MTQTPRSLKEWFAELQPLSVSERERRLVDCAAIDPAMTAELRELLAADVGDDSFLAGLPDAANALPPAPPTAATIGPYRRIRILGEGGMGTVWLCEQDAPVHRRVAIKQIKPGLASADFARRFGRERQVLASLQHPGIAAVFDCGDGDDGPWFAMEFVEGTPLLRYCDEHRLPIDARLGLLLDLCSAVQHAHDRQIVHRDLKPSNILVTTVDGRPFPKVIDFGLAALIADPAGDERLTRPDQWLGTPEYMAPEQRLAGGSVDARADVYALGVVAYELLCGALPFASRRAHSTPTTPVEPPRPSDRLGQLGADLTEVAATRRTRPSQLRATLRAELDWIVLKAIDHDPERRYASVAELADDVRRHLHHQPIRAHAPSTMQRLRKFVRRRRLALAVGAGLVIAAVSAVALTTSAQAERKQKAATMWQQGRVAARDGRWDEALAEFAKALASDPADPLAIEIDRHEALCARGDIAEGSQVLQQIRDRAVATAHEATVAMLRGNDIIGADWNAGAKLLEQAVNADQTGRSSLLPADREFAKAMLATDLRVAEAHLRTALEHDNRHLRSMHVLGPILLANGKPEAALELADRYQQWRQHAVEPRLLRPVALAAMGRHDDAVTACIDIDTTQHGDAALLARQIVDTLQVIDLVVDLAARHDVFAGLYGGLRNADLSVVPMPPVELASELAIRLEVGQAHGKLNNIIRGLSRRSPTNPLAAGTDRWHPAILRRFDLQRVTTTLQAMLNRKLPDDPDSLIPEAALATLWQVTHIHDPRPDWTGWTSALPSVRRLSAWLDLGASIAKGAAGPWTLTTEWQPKFAAAVEATSLLRLSDLEFLGLALLAVNMKQPGSAELADRVVARWERPDQPSAEWLLFKAELHLARGSRAEARRLVELVPSNSRKAWVRSLTERLR